MKREVGVESQTCVDVQLEATVDQSLTTVSGIACNLTDQRCQNTRVLHGWTKPCLQTEATLTILCYLLDLQFARSLLILERKSVSSLQKRVPLMRCRDRRTIE